MWCTSKATELGGHCKPPSAPLPHLRTFLTLLSSIGHHTCSVLPHFCAHLFFVPAFSPTSAGVGTSDIIGTSSQRCWNAWITLWNPISRLWLLLEVCVWCRTPSIRFASCGSRRFGCANYWKRRAHTPHILAGMENVHCCGPKHGCRSAVESPKLSSVGERFRATLARCSGV